MSTVFRRLLLFILLLVPACLCAQTDSYGILTGMVADSVTKEPLPEVTLRVLNTGKSTLANSEGAFRIVLPYGTYTFIFSHVSHRPDTLSVVIKDSLQTLDILMQSATVELPTVHVYERQYDAAQLIIRNAILHKKNILSMLHDYEFAAYTKLLVSKTDSAKKNPIEFITETQLKGYWQKPNRYKEILMARRQSANINAEDNLVTIGDILNFNTNRVEIERYKIVSPTAEDAMDYYNYYLLDTLIVDGRRIFHLEMEPKSQTTPLFVGTIDIADSSFAVAGVDVGFNDLFSGSAMRHARYVQKLAPLQDSIWMPNEIRFTGDIKIPLPGIPIYHIDYVAVLHEYTFNQGLPKGVLNEYALEVDRHADKVDSVKWNAQTIIPLTKEELLNYQRIDSVEHAPKPVGMTILKYSLLGTLAFMTQPALFHYNRVEGAYLGIGETIPDLISNTIISAKAGYSFAAHRWEQNYSATYQLWRQKRLRLTTEYHDRFQTLDMIRPHVDYNPTIEALFFQSDPFHYYRDQGFSIGLGISPLRHIRTSVTYANSDQFSASRNTNYAIFDDDDGFIENVPITNGTDRSVEFTLRHDNRPIIMNKNRETRDNAPAYTVVEISAKLASPEATHSDFDYQQYRFSVYEKFRLFDWGITTFAPSIGVVDGTPPTQQYFTTPVSFIGDVTDFKTFKDVSFGGKRLYSLYLAHDFGRVLFKKMHLPGSLPLTFQLYGGTFWFEGNAGSTSADSNMVVTKKKPYSEIGFGIGRIPPLSMTVYFTFQLSKYDTYNFTWMIANFLNF